MKYRKEIALFTLVATLVPELFSGNSTLSTFVNPIAFVLFFCIYGVTVLLIREFAVRKNIGYFGLFIIGFAYSIYNEGLIAKTMILNSDLPMMQYDYYGYHLGFAIPWSFAISLWHAVCSVLFPVLFFNFLYPDLARTPLLSAGMRRFATVIVFVLGTLSFLADQQTRGSIGQFIILLIFAYLLFMLSKRFKNSPHHQLHISTFKPFWLGLSTLLFYFVILLNVAGAKLPVPFYFFLYAVGIWIYLKMLIVNKWIDTNNLLLFSAGCLAQTTLLNMFAAFAQPQLFLQRIVVSIGAEIFLYVLAQRIIRKSRTAAQ